jgi:plastocyanin
MSAPRLRVGACAAALAILLVSCGGGGGDDGGASYKPPTGPAVATIDIEAGNFYFKPDQIDAKAGINEIKLTSAGGLHDLVFDNGKVPGFQLEVAGSGDSASNKVDLKPGKYVFYCDIAGHRAQGMEGTITVK